uniref:Protein transport protein sec16 n=1 Tax=Scophthalmus maximus TaxID=52904 RepID=A0A8D3BJL6_SCOMX
MQPPPRTGPPGASGPPPSGPNMFRRTRPHKHTAPAAAATATMPPATQPMTDPFAFVRAPPPMAAGGLPTLSSSNPPPMQAPPNTMYSQAGGGLPPQPRTLEDVPAAPSGPPPSSVSGVTLFNPHSTASPGGFPAPSPSGYASSHTEQGYFNSREQPPSTATEPPPVSSAPAPSQIPFNQEFQGQPPPQPVPFQPAPPATSSSQWAPDHGSRPPSVQNYFQPTSDPPPQPFNIPPQPQMYLSHAPSPHHNTPTSPTHLGHPQIPAPLPTQNPVNVPGFQWSDPNATQQHNSHFQTQSYFSQSSAPQDSWFSQPTQDSGYHQMGTGPVHSQPKPDAQHASSFEPEPGPSSAPPPLPYSQESGTLSMFFKDNDVENEETLAGDRNKAVNGIPGSFQHHNNPQTHSVHADVSMDYQGPSLQDHSHVPYMNDGNHASQGSTQKRPDSQYDHVENLECVPNQEVLPSEAHGSLAAIAVNEVDQFETGPNLETPDSVPRPMRSASVSSNYSNMSHGSGTGPRRHQGVVGTFIQQESPRLIDDANLSAATGGYFEQIDTSPAGDLGARQNSQEQMWQPTPSPPKPTGIFQASANSSFEPVRSHSVGVRPAEVDMAKIVAEGGSDSTPGNLEQPPDNMENIYGPGHPLLPGTGVSVPHLTHPVVHSHSRPSSRAHGASRPCESPATTLWAQSDPTSLGANILLAPAAPTVLAPLREPSADVIQPPEDGPLDLQASQRFQPTSQQHSENLENPPKVSDAESTDAQGNMGYASLLVTDSRQQPVLIAPPVSNYSVISPSPSLQPASQISLRETTPPVRSHAQGQGASTSQSPPVASYPNPLFPPGPMNGYDDQWRYYPGYDPSFDDEYQRRAEVYADEFDRRSVHSEQSAHSVHSSQSHHSRRSSFSSRSQQHSLNSHRILPNTRSLTLVCPVAPPRPATPEKFAMPHRCARFGPGGHLVQVLPNLPSAGQPALVDVYNMETMLQDTPDQAELRAFPGPLVKEETHKVDVIKFSQNKALECSRDNNLLDRDSARLLWDFIVLLCRQNGTVVGTDIADLLLKEHRSVWLPGKSPNEANLIDFNNEPLARAEEEPGAGPLSLLSDTFMTVPENIGKETERFRELLLFGRKKDALEAAMKVGLWGHALLLASKMDNRTHARVMTRFANSLPINDPLQTVYQLMSGRMPASATCCGEEKWGDWRPHLAMVLSNLTHTLDLDTRTITTMGDTLASKGLIDAAHFCYMMAQVGLGVFTKKSTKMVLIGSNHSFPFYQFATNEAIQRTEAYEYAQSLGSQPCSLPNFQVFKLIYACRLAEAGLSAQAFHYCEVISRTVLTQPSFYSPVFIRQVIQMSEKLRFFDPQLKEKPEQELFNEPEWLIHLRQLDGQIRVRKSKGMAPPQPLPPSDVPQFYPVPPSGPPGLMSVAGYPPQDPGFAPPPFQPQPEQSEMYPGSHQQPFAPPTQLGQMPPHMPPQVPHSPMQMNHPPPQMPQHMPPSPGYMPPLEQPYQPPPEMQPAQPISSSPRRNSFTPQMDFYDHMERCVCFSALQASGRRSRTTSESSTHSVGRERSNSTVTQISPHPPSIPEQPRAEEAKKVKRDSPKKCNLKCISFYTQSGGIGGGGGGGGGKNEAHLPDDKNNSIVWDEKRQRWVDLNEPEEESKPPPPPPSGFPKMPPMPGPGGPAAPPSGGPPVNMFSRKAGTKSRYVDVLNPSRTARPAGLAPAPVDIFAPLAPMPMSANLFVPSSGLSRSSSMSSLSREVSQHLNQVPLAGPSNGSLSPPPAHPPQLITSSTLHCLHTEPT